MCRPPPKPLDRQISTHYANEERINYRPPPKPPYILNVNGEVIGIIKKENMPYVVPKSRPLPKPPRIYSKDNREGIRDPEKEHLLDTEPNYRPPPNLPKGF